MLPKLIATTHRVLIFSQMVQLMDIMEQYFYYRNISFLRLDGSTKADDRGERMALFNQKNSDYKVFLLSTRAGGLGLNLQTADTVVIFDSDWNPQMDVQAQDRAHRIGQKNEVHVYRLITNSSIEEQILQKAAQKMNLDEMIIQAGLYNQRSTDAERKARLEEMFKKREEDEDEGEGTPNDFEINKIMCRSEAEFELFQQMDQERYEREKSVYKHFKHPQNLDDGKFYNYRLMAEDEVPAWIKVQVSRWRAI